MPAALELAIEALKNPRRALPDAAKSARRPAKLSWPETKIGWRLRLRDRAIFIKKKSYLLGNNSRCLGRGPWKGVCQSLMVDPGAPLGRCKWGGDCRNFAGSSWAGGSPRRTSGRWHLLAICNFT